MVLEQVHEPFEGCGVFAAGGPCAPVHEMLYEKGQVLQALPQRQEYTPASAMVANARRRPDALRTSRVSHDATRSDGSRTRIIAKRGRKIKAAALFGRRRLSAHCRFATHRHLPSPTPSRAWRWGSLRKRNAALRPARAGAPGLLPPSPRLRAATASRTATPRASARYRSPAASGACDPPHPGGPSPGTPVALSAPQPARAAIRVEGGGQR
jgi:hypothetical protein